MREAVEAVGGHAGVERTDFDAVLLSRLPDSPGCLQLIVLIAHEEGVQNVATEFVVWVPQLLCQAHPVIRVLPTSGDEGPAEADVQSYGSDSHIFILPRPTVQYALRTAGA